MPSKILSLTAWAAMTLWSRSLTVRSVRKSTSDRLIAEGKNVIYAFWHDSMFLLPYGHRNTGIAVMVSESKDGEIATGMLGHFGFHVVRGSSKRRGSRALIGLIRSMHTGKSSAIAVDGPRGPRHKVKEGAVFLAGLLRSPIIPVVSRARHCWTLERTWDRFTLPMPFTKGVVLYGEAIAVNGTSREEIESKRRELETALLMLTQEAAREEQSLSSLSQRGGTKTQSERFSFPER